jgi:hypothetical protein
VLGIEAPPNDFHRHEKGEFMQSTCILLTHYIPEKLSIVLNFRELHKVE